MVEWATREELTRRLHALVEDMLDRIEADKDTTSGYDLGVVMILAEVLNPSGEPATELLRSDARYTPAGDPAYWFHYSCSDARWWIKKAIVTEAYEYYSGWTSSTDEDEEDAEDENASTDS